MHAVIVVIPPLLLLTDIYCVIVVGVCYHCMHVILSSCGTPFDMPSVLHFMRTSAPAYLANLVSFPYGDMNSSFLLNERCFI